MPSGELRVFEKSLHELSERRCELAYRRRPSFVCVVENRGLATGRAAAQIEKNLVSISLQGKFCEAHHPSTRRWPHSALEGDHGLLLRCKAVEWFECM